MSLKVFSEPNWRLLWAVIGLTGPSPSLISSPNQNCQTTLLHSLVVNKNHDNIIIENTQTLQHLLLTALARDRAYLDHHLMRLKSCIMSVSLRLFSFLIWLGC